MRSDQMHQAAQSLENGDNAAARRILRELILQNPHDEAAWMLMAEAVDQEQQVIDCLERVLRINPHNQEASEKLAGLRGKSLEKERWGRSLNWPLIIGSVLVAFTLILAYFGPSFAKKDPLEMSTVQRAGEKYLIPPYPPGTPGYPLGSDGNGRDLLSRILWGLQPTLGMVLIVAGVRLVVGTLIGLVSGWSRGLAGRILDMTIAAALSIPVIIVALGGIAAVGVDLGIWAFIFGLSITGWVETARIVREQTQAVRGQVYIEAAHALGASNISILLRHVLGQIFSLLWMLFAFEISATLMLTAALGFLGYYIGGDIWVAVTDSTATAVSGAPELGQMLATSGVSITKPWGLLIIGAFVFIIVLGFNLLGEGLRKQLSLYGKRGSTRFSRFLADSRFWFEEHIAWPVSNLTHSATFRPALALVAVTAVLGSGLWWGYSHFFAPTDSTQVNSKLNLEQLWANARRDPFGTRWVQAAGPQSPGISWTFTDEGGFSGGPVVAMDGTVYVTSNHGILNALKADGTLLWQTSLPERPIASPALNKDGYIYVADEKGGLSAIAPGGSLLWHYQPEGDRYTTAGPVVTRDGSVYYVVSGAIRAVSPDGELLWETQVGASTNTAFSEMVQISPKGDLLFWGDMLLDAKDGSIQETETPGHADQYFIGADGNIYQIEGHEVTQWDGEGLNAKKGAVFTWDHSKFTLSRTPEDAGATQNGVVWLFYTGFARTWGLGEDTRLVWIDKGGNTIGIAYHPIRNSQVIGIDNENILYICGNLEQGYGDPQCGAFSPDSNQALWTLDLEGSQEVAGGALIPGRLYIASTEGVLYALGLPEPSPLVEQSPTLPAELTEPSENDQGILNERSQPTGPKDGSSSLIFEEKAGFTGGPAIGEENTIYLLSKSGSLYALNPEGELVWQASLPANPVGTPITGPQGRVYISDAEGALSAYNPTGELIWRFTPSGDFKAISGPAIGPDGRLYYTLQAKGGMIQAVSPDGEGLWMADLETSQVYNTPEVSPDGNFIFFMNEIFDASTGSALDFNLDFEVDEFFGGEDGRNYLRAGNTIIEWEPAGEGIALSEERVLISDEHMGEPIGAYVSPEGVVWLHYNSTIFWFTKVGEALGASSPDDAFLTSPVAIDHDLSVYVCGRKPRNRLMDPKPICYALSFNAEKPLWEAQLSDKSEKINGGALVPGALFITTEEGHLYRIGTTKIEPSSFSPDEGSLIFEDDDGFSGAPAVAENGTLYIASNVGQLYSLNPGGQINWQVTLPAGPTGAPSIGTHGEIYLTLKDGSLSTYNTSGELIWRFTPQGKYEATSGVGIGNDGVLYYTLRDKRGMLQAVSPQGEGLWLSELNTPFFYHTPQISGDGNFIFVQDEIFDTRTGDPIDFGLDFKIDEFIAGQDGRNYLRTEGTIVAWVPSGSTISLADERVLSPEGRPDSAGVSQEGIVWLRYDNQYLWFTQEGEALGVNSTNKRANNYFIEVDRDSVIYVCGEYAQPTCSALSWSKEEPLWEVPLGDSYENIAGTTYTLDKRLYVSTEEGHLYVLGGVK